MELLNAPFLYMIRTESLERGKQSSASIDFSQSQALTSLFLYFKWSSYNMSHIYGLNKSLSHIWEKLSLILNKVQVNLSFMWFTTCPSSGFWWNGRIVKSWERIQIEKFSFQTEIGATTEKNENTPDGDLLKVNFMFGNYGLSLKRWALVEGFVLILSTA